MSFLNNILKKITKFWYFQFRKKLMFYEKSTYLWVITLYIIVIELKIFKALRNVKSHYIANIPRSTLTQSGSTC